MDSLAGLPYCGKGFYCIGAAESRWPLIERVGYYGPCPAGHYCLAGDDAAVTASPTPCPDGKYNAQVGSWSADFCLECPPGWLCTTPGAVGGLTAPSAVCEDGNRCVDGLVSIPCTTTGFYCPLESHEELLCPVGFYSLSGKGYCLECPAGKYCMNGSQENCPAGYFCHGV